MTLMLTSAPLAPGADEMTTASFILIALGMICAVAIIWWGTVRRRARANDMLEAERHAIKAGHPPLETDPDETPGDDASTAPIEAGPAASSAAATPAPAQQPAGDPMPVTLLKGLGPKAAAQLAALGITDIAQLAALGDAEIAALDGQMGALAGRIGRDRWIEQARMLAAGDRAGFEAAFGKLGA